VTGGAGFIGTNLCDRLLSRGQEVTVLDDLSRSGAADNLNWLQSRHHTRLRAVVADVRDEAAVRESLEGVGNVFHFAAQVAVTTSLERPAEDFGVNLGGTLNVLERIRERPSPPTILFTSTNKVYGDLADLALTAESGRYEPVEQQVKARGVSEQRSLACVSPYGCSKGGADQYVLDYARSFGVRAVVFRMSCIYGPHQHGNEDQGWVAHFIKRALARSPITLYGDGRQVRDLLFVDDLVDAMLVAVDGLGHLSGSAFNMGGGPANAVSLLDVLEIIGEFIGAQPDVRRATWRLGDQRWYVSDTSAFRQRTGWAPSVDVASGVRQLCAWLQCQESTEVSAMSPAAGR
jgi:CDP-paratose 2-epimerase